MNLKKRRTLIIAYLCLTVGFALIRPETAILATISNIFFILLVLEVLSLLLIKVLDWDA